LPIFINQIATSLPQHKYDVEEISSFLADSAKNKISGRKAKIVASKSGIQTRYSVLEDFRKGASRALFNAPIPSIEARLAQYNLHALPLALKAIDQLTAFNPSTVTHIITSKFSCSSLHPSLPCFQDIRAISDAIRTVLVREYFEHHR
jgi:alpha-pyrone synthase